MTNIYFVGHIMGSLEYINSGGDPQNRGRYGVNVTNNIINRDHALCSAVTLSMTNAMKAQRLLTRYAIRASVKKISGSMRGEGCVYGIEFECGQLSQVRSVLESYGLTVKEYLR